MFVAFIVYITMKGELPTYLGIFGLGTVPTNCNPNTSSTTGSTVAGGGFWGNVMCGITGGAACASQVPQPAPSTPAPTQPTAPVPQPAPQPQSFQQYYNSLPYYG